MADDGFQLTDIRFPFVADFFDDLFGNTYENPDITGPEADELVGRMRAAGVPQEIIDRFAFDYLRPDNVGYQQGVDAVDAIIREFEGQNRATEIEAEDDGNRAALLTRLAERREPLDRRFGELDTIARNPNSVRSDAEFGAILGQRINEVNSALNEQRRRLAASTASSGLRSSGRTANSAQRLDLLGGALRGRAFADTLGDVRTELGRVGGQLDRADAFEFDINNNGFNNALAIEDLFAGYEDPESQVEDIQGYDFGLQGARSGDQYGAFGALTGTVQQGFDNTFDFIEGFGGD